MQMQMQQQQLTLTSLVQDKTDSQLAGREELEEGGPGELITSIGKKRIECTE